MKNSFLIAVVLCLGLASAVFAQDLTTKGSIGGRVLDPAGAAVPGARVTVVGQTGVPAAVVTNDEGYFEVKNLDPGNYSVSVEMQGFKTAKIDRVEVLVGRQNTVTANLEVGPVGETVVVTDVAQIDQQSTAIGANLNDQLYQNIPVQRNVQSLFYLAPGATDSGAGGRANPSISGGSALDNLYIADGVNITDAAFGGLGAFSRVYGTLGVGINTSYIKEVQVKTGGFEPQYGQSQGGIINIVTKSGGNDYHGAIYGYAQPRFFEAARRHADDYRTNKVGKILHQEFYDVGADFSGYIPGARNHLFFFGSFNPTIRRDVGLGAARNAFDRERGVGTDSGIFNLLGEYAQRYRTWNYAFKLDYNINANHTINFSTFGDPTLTNSAPFNTLNVDVLTTNSVLDFGTRNTALKYNGAIGATNPLTISATFSKGTNHFAETGFANFYQLTDRTNLARGNFRAAGRGFIENTDSVNWRGTLDLTKQVSVFGTHTLGAGYTYQRSTFGGLRTRSGSLYPIPEANLAAGNPAFPASQVYITPSNVAGQLTDTALSLRIAPYACTLCPLLNVNGVDEPVYLTVDRGEFGQTRMFTTQANYHAAYIQDTWRVNKYINALLGLRWEQEEVIGSPRTDLPNNQRYSYTLTGQWAPRIGVTIDPSGRGKMKIYYNFGRFFEYLPLDLGERSLSQEQDFTNSRYIPEFIVDANGQRRAVINAFGTVNPIFDQDHFISGINRANGGVGSGNLANTSLTNRGTLPSVSSSSLVAFLPGTKLGFTDENLVGFETQLPRNFVLSVRFMDRRIKRIIEDGAVLSPEAYNAGIGQTYFLGNLGPSTDGGINLEPFIFHAVFDADGNILNTPAGCVQDEAHQPTYFTEPTDFQGNLLGSVCFGTRGIDASGNSIASPDGTPDGFAQALHIYRALEVEVNKRFSDNWQLLSNVRFASLRGNYEGHLRNDNEQTDPGNSSTYDFTLGDFNLLGDQFAPGPLNTDRRVVANIYGSYTFGKEGFGRRFHGMTLGANLRGESGVPISEFLAHPAYNNAGEIPVGGRGKLGRTSPFYRLDLHMDYPYQFTETMRLSFVADFFNVTNNRAIRTVDQFRENTTNQLNPDFLAPRTQQRAFQLPFNMRLGLRFEF